MDRIDKYIDSIFKQAHGTPEEINSLKEEMRIHLRQAVEELMSQGISENESIALAISRFGEEQNLEEELGREFKAQRNYKKPIIILVVIGLIFLIGSSLYQSYKASKWGDNLILPDGFTIIDRVDRPVQSYTPIMIREGEIIVDDKETIQKIVNYILEARLSPASRAEADKFSEKDRMFSVGNYYFQARPLGALSTIAIKKDGSFITSKSIEGNKELYVKGKLSKAAVKELNDIYKNYKSPLK